MKRFNHCRWIPGLLLCLCLVCLCAAAFALTGSCGDNMTWTLDEYGTLTIEGYGDMKQPTPSWPSNDVKELEFKSVGTGITSICESAFVGHVNLKGVVEFPASVKEIGDYAFNACLSLAGVSIKDGVEKVGDYAFFGCTSLKNVRIGANQYGTCAFSDCTALKIVEIETTSGKTMDFGNIFSGCTNLEIVDVQFSPLYDSRDGVVFSLDGKTLVWCPLGKSGAYEIPDKTQTIDKFAFSCCTKLTSIKIPESVTEIMNGAFEACTGLTSITIPSGVKMLYSYAFMDCTGLTEVILPDGLLTITSEAFKGCTGLTHITIPESVKTIGDHVFSGCPLEKVELSANVTYIGDGAFDKNVPVYAPAGSKAEEWAEQNGYKVNEFKVAVGSEGHGTAVADKEVAKAGTLVTLTATPDEGYELDAWKVVSGGVTVADNQFTMGSQDVEIKAAFKEKKDVLFKVEVESDGHGTASADVTEAKTGTVVTLTAVPDERYRLESWTVVIGGVTVTDNKFTMGEQDVKIRAVFSRIPVDLSTASVDAVPDQVYTGKAISPALTVTGGGFALKKGEDYTVAFSQNKEIGKAKATLTAIAPNTGTKTVSFNIIPKGVAFSSVKGTWKTLNLKWKKGKAIDGYEIEYSLKKNFSKPKKITVKKIKTTKWEISGLKENKAYYLRIRTYKKVGKKVYYSAWSGVKKAKTK